MKNKEKIKRFYIMDDIWVTVTQSQVFNWIKIINENGITTDCISITRAKAKTSAIEKIEKSISGKFIQVYDIKKLIIRDIFLSLTLFKYYIKSVRKYEKIIFQTRLSDIGLTFFLLKWLPKSKFIFESRGAGLEERAHVNKGKKDSFKSKIQNFFGQKSEKNLIEKSNVVICVSNALKKYFVDKYNISNDKVYVFPGAADSNLFFYDDSFKNEVRKELDIDPKNLLIVYSGRLSAEWEIADKIFTFFKNLYDKNNKFRILIITPTLDFARKLITDYDITHLATVQGVKLEDVNRYLNAADLGILLREDVLMNNVASPTKFPEYLMAGLPVIISKGVHDFVDIIKMTGYGVVVSKLETISEEEYQELMKTLIIRKSQISEWGKNNLSKTSFIKEYIELLSKV